MWWKKVWKLTGKKKSSINLSEQGSDSKLEDKDAAHMINTFFADLTNDFPETPDGHRTVIQMSCRLLHLKALRKSFCPFSLTKLPVQMTPTSR
jgi:hypothetical protein